jgi:hypothetical protein
MSSPEHQAILEQSIQEGIRHVLGESGLEMVLSLHPLSHLSADPVAFHGFLKGIFMDDGAAIIEIEIASRLLDKVGNSRGREGRSFLSWLGATFSRARSPGAGSARENDALRQFLALESVRKSRSSEDKLGAHCWTNRGRSLELTVSRFPFPLKGN